MGSDLSGTGRGLGAGRRGEGTNNGVIHRCDRRDKESSHWYSSRHMCVDGPRETDRDTQKDRQETERDRE